MSESSTRTLVVPNAGNAFGGALATTPAREDASKFQAREADVPEDRMNTPQLPPETFDLRQLIGRALRELRQARLSADEPSAARCERRMNALLDHLARSLHPKDVELVETSICAKAPANR